MYKNQIFNIIKPLASLKTVAKKAKSQHNDWPYVRYQGTLWMNQFALMAFIMIETV